MSRGFLAVLFAIGLVAAAILGWTRWTDRSRPGRATAASAPDAGRQLQARLRAEAELEISPTRLEAVGRAARERIEERLDRVARSLDADAGDWRPGFAVLAGRHPATESAVLDLYRAELEAAEAFVRERRLVPMPETGIRVEPVHNPVLRRAFPLALYLEPGRLGVVLRPPRARDRRNQGEKKVEVGAPA